MIAAKKCVVLAISLEVLNCHEFRHFVQLESPKLPDKMD